MIQFQIFRRVSRAAVSNGLEVRGIGGGGVWSVGRSWELAVGVSLDSAVGRAGRNSKRSCSCWLALGSCPLVSEQIELPLH